MNYGTSIICTVFAVLFVLGAVTQWPKKPAAKESAEKPAPAPRDQEIKIEHEIRIVNGDRKEHWYTYVYAAKPGWVLSRSHTSEEGARQWKKIVDSQWTPEQVLLREEIK